MVERLDGSMDNLREDLCLLIICFPLRMPASNKLHRETCWVTNWVEDCPVNQHLNNILSWIGAVNRGSRLQCGHPLSVVRHASIIP